MENKKKIKITVITFIKIIVITFIAVIFAMPLIIRAMYDKAGNLVWIDHNYAEAIEIYRKLDDKECLEDAMWRYGYTLYDNGEYLDSAQTFYELANMQGEDSIWLKEAVGAAYAYAEQLCERGECSRADDILEAILASDKSNIYRGDNDYGSLAVTKNDVELMIIYNDAMEYLVNGDKGMAAITFGRLINFKDAEERAAELWDDVAPRTNLSAGYDFTIGINSDGKAYVVENHIDTSWNTSYYDAQIYFDFNAPEWSDLISVDSGDYHVAALRKDGTVVAQGKNDNGCCDVSEWSDIVSISAGRRYTVGLTSYGTVVVTPGTNFNVSSWSDIIAISAGQNHILGLKADGTVVATGSNEEGQCRVDSWRNITAVSAGGYHSVGLCSNGTVVAAGSNDDWQCDVSGWKNIKQISAGQLHTVALRSDGTVAAAGKDWFGRTLDCCQVSDWSGVVQLSAGSYHSIAVDSNGKVKIAK